jgi:hypothetical protein
MNTLTALAITMFQNHDNYNSDWKEEILKKWKTSSNLPRKEKKKTRKTLLVKWSIACWDPFENL